MISLINSAVAFSFGYGPQGVQQKAQNRRLEPSPPLFLLWRGVIDTAMFGRPEPDQKKICLVVEDEQALYTSFSPEDELTEKVT